MAPDARCGCICERLSTTASYPPRLGLCVAEIVATTASATLSNVVGMIGTEAGLSVQAAAMKFRWCVPPINVLQTGFQPFPDAAFFLLASASNQLDKADPPPISEAYIYLGVQFVVLTL